MIVYVVVLTAEKKPENFTIYAGGDQGLAVQITREACLTRDVREVRIEEWVDGKFTCYHFYSPVNARKEWEADDG